MKKILLIVAAAAFGCGAWAQEPVEIKIWPAGPPNSNGLSGTENDLNEGRVDNVVDPVVYYYAADAEKNTGAALVICPGGGYARLAMNHEGHEIAKWLAGEGISAFVLKYRMPNGHPDVPLSDAHQAIRLVRENATAWGIDPQKVGIAGSSAGGHLASTAVTHFDAQTRPDYGVLFYPVVSFDPAIHHKGSSVNLLGESPDQAMIDLYSNEKQVTAETPPVLLFHSDDDRTVPVQNSVAFYAALKAHQVPGVIYVFPNGGHGWGFRETFRYHEEWKTLLIKWLYDIGITR